LKSEPEDINLLRNIKQGDSHSFELLFRRLYPKLCAYAQKFLHDTNDSKEVVQELFLNIWKNRDRIDEGQSLTSYLFISTKNRCLNLLETKKNRSKHAELLWYLYVQESTENNNAFQQLVVNDLEKNLNIAVEHLPKECKKIFELSRYEGLKYQEIAQQLNISIKTVETQMSRALTKLRLEMKEHLTMLLILFILK
jgi:RNA polymerase sigma-70 factor (ECF subfamily)